MPNTTDTLQTPLFLDKGRSFLMVTSLWIQKWRITHPEFSVEDLSTPGKLTPEQSKEVLDSYDDFCRAYFEELKRS